MAGITIDIDISARVTRPWASDLDTRQVLLGSILVDTDTANRVVCAFEAEVDAACRIHQPVNVLARIQAVVFAEITRLLATGQAVHNRLNRSADLWLVVHGRLGVDADAAVRVTRPWLRSIDTSVRTSGAHISLSDTVQRIAIPAGLLADTRQILFAVLIDQDHEIQT
ncbi:hypothetical protein LF599_08975 [Pseudodesulfovibrio thermohalotolerans]|uniref:hypothetical protein n=1 Tax=Pseudodesulfovibrio thermohalotolerans TaxID=2880651 RepID=UPI0022B9E9D7|nr:hypothetical protein [Pseudodesulfovibrio thermohalotolerans]WFS64270.1 hypothetical protein LF599_08975 [Pseudodesulfovibrio thermohalotolerans]